MLPFFGKSIKSFRASGGNSSLMHTTFWPLVNIRLDDQSPQTPSLGSTLTHRSFRFNFAKHEALFSRPSTSKFKGFFEQGFDVRLDLPDKAQVMKRASIPDLEQAIRTVPDFPKSGIQFKDITPVLADGHLFSSVIDHLLDGIQADSIDLIVGIDARGFILGAAAAGRLGVGFIPIRKKGKLPWTTIEQNYDLEYGTNTMAIHTDAIQSGQRVLLIDDLLATGGTAAAALALVRQLGATVVGVRFLIELTFLEGRKHLGAHDIRSLISY